MFLISDIKHCTIKNNVPILVEKGVTDFPESPEALDVENRASFNLMVPIVLITVFP